MYCRIFPYEFEVSPGAMVVFGDGPRRMESAVVHFRIVTVGVRDGAAQRYVPHVRDFSYKGVEAASRIPAEFQKGGSATEAAAGSDPEEAADALCEAFLQAIEEVA